MANSYNHETVAYYRAYRYSLHSASINKDFFKMNGARRVVVFCLVTVVLPTILIIIPLYLRNSVFADVTFEVAESDVLEIGEDISPIFCQEHTIKMNDTFNAYQVDSKPEISNTRKHIRLKKSMRLPDDTLEYWGFFLPKGSIVQLSVCSRYDGSRILVVKGMKNLHTCGLLDHSKKSRPDATQFSGAGQFRVRFEMDDRDTFAPLPPTPADDKALKPVASEPANETTTRASRSAEDENNGGEVEDDNLIGEEGEQPARNKHRHAMNGKNHERRSRDRRSTHPVVPHNLDGKVVHGGVAANQTDDDEDSSESSFEAELLDCYGGNILLKQEFPSSALCSNVSYLLRNHTSRMTTTHTVVEDGYYYYIFYSDNDLVENDIHAVFDIHKPTYQYANISKRCINETSCTFPVAFLSREIVIVEVPTRDGIEHEAEDISLLVSVCHPRMSVYIIFPLLVLILILGCAFL